MSVRSNQELLDAYVEAFNAHDAERLASMHTEFGKVVNAVTSPLKEGRKQIADFYAGIFAGWPDCRWENPHSFGLDGLMCMEWTFTGSSASHPNTSVKMWDCGVFTLENGKVAEVRFYIDTGTIAKQWEAQGIVK